MPALHYGHLRPLCARRRGNWKGKGRLTLRYDDVKCRRCKQLYITGLEQKIVKGA
jgi:hypothetical protein